MRKLNTLDFQTKQIVSIPFLDNQIYVIGGMRKGGMGAVYKLVPTKPNMPILALKTYQTSDGIESFEKEARIWISLSNHSGVAKALSFGILQDVGCIVSLWYSRNMADLDAGAMNYESVCNFISEILITLDFGASQHHLIHKDIKPDNILLTDTNRPVLADFGISKTSAESDLLSYGWTETSDMKKGIPISGIAGTPRYMAPELFSGVHNSIRTDIFAFGVSIYEWLMHKHPYFSEDGRILDLNLGELQNRLGRLFGRQGEILFTLIVRSISLDVNDRFSTYKEMIGLLNCTKTKPISDESQSSASIVSYSQTLRRQGKIPQAIHVLEDALSKSPDDVLLLQGFATLYFKIRNNKSAWELLVKAVQINLENRCRYKGEVYIEPNVNLSQVLILSMQHEAAANVLEEMKKALSVDASEVFIAYWEFGWLQLYIGQVDEALNYLLYYISKHKPTTIQMALCCLAIHLTHKESIAPRVWKLISSHTYSDVEAAQYICIIATFAMLHKSQIDLAQVLSKTVLSELDGLGVSLAGERGAFHLPMNHNDITKLLRFADDKFLGGKHAEHI